MTATRQGPRTVGAPIADMTMRERAAWAYELKAAADRKKAESDARKLALDVLGVHEVEFDDFIPDAYARRNDYAPAARVTFEVEGLEFQYFAAFQSRGERYRSALYLIDRCPCGDGVRVLQPVHEIADIGYAFACRDWTDKRCTGCKDSPMT